jgi:hypothetical protein
MNYTKKLNGMILKINFEKDYDKEKRSFSSINCENERFLKRVVCFDP